MEIVKVIVGTLPSTGGGGSVTVIDNLNSTSSAAALSANQGHILKGLVDSKANTTALSGVAFSGRYTDLTDTPQVVVADTMPPDISGYPDGTFFLIG